MPWTRPLGLATSIGFLLAALTAGGGCQSSRGPALGTPPMLGARPAAAPAVAAQPAQPIAPHNVVRWAVASGQTPRSPGITGRDTVAADGTLRLGPYGSIQVAGLMPEEARTAIVNHVSRQVTDPRVSLHVEAPARPGPLQRLFTRNSEPPANAEWHYGKPPAPNGGNRLTPVPQPNPAEIRPVTGASPSNPRTSLKPALGDPRIQQVSGSEQTAGQEQPAGAETETAPQPAVIATHPPVFDSVIGPDAKPIPRELSQVSLPAYVIDPPDILLIESTQGLKTQPIKGAHLVRPDGTIGLGIYGSVRVAGMTLDQAKVAIVNHLSPRIKEIDPLELNVDVIAYNSKFYYVITDGAGYGEQVVRIPITGHENVLDAISQVNGLPPVASKKHIWVARRAPNDGQGQQVLPVDWVGITQRGSTATNYQVLPGDRIYVQSDRLIRIDNGLAKILNPIERLLGVTLLGSSVVNSIEGRGAFGGAGAGIR